MPDINLDSMQKKRIFSHWLKDSFSVILALVFIALYAAAFAGKLNPLKDNTMLIRLEPVIFILIGYYFGRHPSRQCEETLRDEIIRQHRGTEAAQFAKGNLQEERGRLEEKIKNVRITIEKLGNSDTEPDKNTLKVISGILDK